MKTRIYTLFIAAASLLVAACQTTPTETVGLESALLPKTVQFTAGAPGTRTAFTDPEGTTYPVQWTENDTEVLIWRNRSASELNAATVSPSEDRTSAKFETVFLPATGGVTYYLASPSSAVDADASIADGQWHFSVPEGQTPSEKSVDEAAQILVSKSETYETDPDSVPLHLVHWTSYGCLTLSNLDLGGEPLASVVLEAEVPWAGEWSYDPESGQSTYVGDADAGKSLFLTATDAGAVWFACAPVNMGGKTLKVTARGTKQTRIRTVTLPSSAIPEAKTFESGKIALVTIDMKDAESPESPDSKTYELVTKGGSLTEGGKFVITAAEYDVAMSTTQNEKNRGQVAVTKSDNTIVNPPDDVEVVTLESGVTSGTWAFKTRDGRYLGTIFGSNSLTTQDTKSETTDWRISYSSAGAVTIKNIETKSLSLIYNPNSHYFWAVVATVSVKSPVSLYKLKVEGDSSGKDDPKLRLVKSSLTLTEGETGSVKVGLCYSDGALSYESSDEAVVKVDSEGKLTAMKAGEATVTVTVAETEQYQSGSATCKVTVLPPVPVSGITLDKTSVSVVEGESGKLTATVNPSNAANKKVTWSSSNSSVVQVDQDGAFYALKPGTATVTVTSVADNTKKATCVVTVTKFYAVTGVTLDKTSVRLQKGSTVKLTATVTPSNATNVELIWDSDNENVATVDQNGNVKAISGTVGATCTITAVARNKDRGNEHSATCTVTIMQKPDPSKVSFWIAEDNGNESFGPLEEAGKEIQANKWYIIRIRDDVNNVNLLDNYHSFNGTGNSTKTEYQKEIYTDSKGHTYWRVKITTDGYVEMKLKYKSSELDVEAKRVVYVPRNLVLYKNNGVEFGAAEEVNLNLGASAEFSIRHAVTHDEILIDPEYMNFTNSDGEAYSTIAVVNNRTIRVTAKNSPYRTVWNLNYNKYGTRMSRTIIMDMTCQSVTIDKSNGTYFYDNQLHIDVGDELQLSATTVGGSGNVVWSVTDGSGHASITSDGKIKGLSYGFARVQAKSKENYPYALLEVWVYDKATGITIDDISSTEYYNSTPSIWAKPGSTISFRYKVNPSTANQKVKFETTYYAPPINDWPQTNTSVGDGSHRLSINVPSSARYHAGNLEHTAGNRYATKMMTWNGKVSKEIDLAIIQYASSDVKPMDYLIAKKNKNGALRTTDGGLRIMEDFDGRSMIVTKNPGSVSSDEAVVAVIHQMRTNTYSYNGGWQVSNIGVNGNRNIHGVAVSIRATGNAVTWANSTYEIAYDSAWPSGNNSYPNPYVSGAEWSSENGLGFTHCSHAFNYLIKDSKYRIKPAQEVVTFAANYPVEDFIFSWLQNQNSACPAYSIWFVPTMKEWLNLKGYGRADVHLGIIRNIERAGGSFPNREEYWLIESYDSTTAWYATYLNGCYKQSKTETAKVRPFIRF